MNIVSQRSLRVQGAMSALLALMNEPAFTRRQTDPLACDFMLGNPQEMPLEGYVEALQSRVVPLNKDWFAYKDNEPASREVLAEALRGWRGKGYRAEDIFLTTGAFAGLAVCLNAVVDPGDEVIFLSPPWFFYEALILSAGGMPVRVMIDRDTFDLDLEAIESAVTPRTRAIIVNSPNNPTGKIYPPESLKGLADILERAARRAGRPVYLLSDESYSKIVYDGRRFLSPTDYYPHSFLIYTYGKTLLAPGQRIGYIALPPELPEPEPVRTAITAAQFLTGYAFPNALLQHALADLEKLSIDVHHLEEKRDRMVAALREMGYPVHKPEGTFYLLPKSPLEDELAFIKLLEKRRVYCLPGRAAEMPGYFRISLTASDEMIERSLPAFAAAVEEAREEKDRTR
jgi:aspartate aminotransferase